MSDCIFFPADSMCKASTGQFSTQAPQRVQDSLTTAQLSDTVMAPKAQLVSQIPHAVHLSLSIISIGKETHVAVAENLLSRDAHEGIRPVGQPVLRHFLKKSCGLHEPQVKTLSPPGWEIPQGLCSGSQHQCR